MTAATIARTLAVGFRWSQSAINDYLTCPRLFMLKHVERRRPDMVSSGFAGPKGNAAHAGLALVLDAANRGLAVESAALASVMLAAFAEALQRATAKGEAFDDDAAEQAIASVTEELLPLVLKIAGDPRIQAVRWERVEARFDWTDAHGRIYQGTLDAAGVAKRRVEAFGAAGRESVSLGEGETIVVDWKTGDIDDAVDHVARALNVQLAFYSVGILKTGGELPARAFLARLGDVAPPKRPKDDQGDGIKSTLREPNPAFCAALGIEAGSVAFEQSKKKPKDAQGAAITKWIERPNPAYVEATSKPRGPIFYQCELNYPLAIRTINDVIRGAELGVFPASGAAQGNCMRCPMRQTCTDGGRGS